MGLLLKRKSENSFQTQTGREAPSTSAAPSPCPPLGRGLVATTCVCWQTGKWNWTGSMLLTGKNLIGFKTVSRFSVLKFNIQ